MRRFLLLLVAISLLGTESAIADAWRLPIDIKPGEVLVAVEESWAPSSSNRRVVFNVKSSGVFESRECDLEYESGDCDLSNPALDFQGTSILGPCQGDSDGDCIESFGLSRLGAQEVSGQLLRSVDTRKYESILAKNLPEFRSTPLFSVPGFIHEAGTDTYVPVVRMTYKWDQVSKKFYASWLDASVYPYLEVADPNSVTSPNCVWSETGKCGVPQIFPEGVRVHLSLRVSKSIAGWFRGRLTTPELSIESLNDKYNRLKVSGDPVRVSRFSAIATEMNTTEEERREIAAMGGNAVSPIFRGGGRHFPFSHWGDFKWLEMFRDLANDTASGESVVWNFSTIAGISSNRCLADSSRVLGLVTTNATVYDGNVPVFQDGELQYRVGGMHYRPDGKSLSQGTYDMVMRSDTARCLYGFSKSPIQASIAVISAEGTEQVSTTSSGERDGWLFLSAKNFTFSTPTVRVKLIQEPITPTEVNKKPELETSSQRVSASITCSKGKKVKIVSTKKCPKGYKKA